MWKLWAVSSLHHNFLISELIIKRKYISQRGIKYYLGEKKYYLWEIKYYKGEMWKVKKKPMRNARAK